MAIPKKGLWIIGILTAIVLIAIGVYKFYKSRFLDSTLPYTVSKESRGLYKISYDTIKVDEIGGSLSVSNLNVNVDTASFSADSLPPGSPSVIINLHADSLTVTGVQTPRALLQNEITGTKVLIQNASIELFRIAKKEKDEDDGNSRKGDLVENIYYDVLRELKLVKMDTILLRNIDISYKDFKTKKLILRSTNVSLLLLNLQIDTNSLNDRSRIFFSKKVEVVADSIHLRDDKGHYDFKFAGLQVNTASKLLTLKSAVIKPLAGEVAFMKQFKYQRDRFDFALSDIRLNGIDPVGLAYGELHADSLTVSSSRFNIYRDARMPRDKVNRVGQYPHQMIMKIPFPVNIEKGFFNNSFVEYKEVNAKTGKAGRVQFNRVQANMTNITNQRSAIKKNDNLTIDYSAWFLNMAKADVRMTLKIGDKQGRFTVKGNLKGFDAKRLNVLIEPLGMARVEKGTIKSINFNMSGDNYRAGGELIMLYDDLKVSTLKLEDDNKTYKKKGLVSLFANAILKNQNPTGNNTRTAEMSNDRNTNRSFFNLIWKSIFTGIKETTGMDIMGKGDQAGEKTEGEKDDAAGSKKEASSKENKEKGKNDTRNKKDAAANKKDATENKKKDEPKVRQKDDSQNEEQ
ncbi:hypothetical protein ACX0G7_14345 [Flavitalea antarctica]